MADIRLKNIIKRVFTKKPGKDTVKTISDLFRWKKTDSEKIDIPIIDYQTGRILSGTRILRLPEDRTRDAYKKLKEINEKIMPKKEKEKKIYYVPVTYEMAGMIPVETESLKKAYDIIQNNPDTVSLPVNPQYIDGSLIVIKDILTDENEDMANIQKFIQTEDQI